MTQPSPDISAQLDDALTVWRNEQASAAVLSAAVADGTLVGRRAVDRALQTKAVNLRRILDIRSRRVGQRLVEGADPTQVLAILRESDAETLETYGREIRLEGAVVDGVPDQFVLQVCAEEAQAIAEQAEQLRTLATETDEGGDQ